jgi:hypothetical protein
VRAQTAARVAIANPLAADVALKAVVTGTRQARGALDRGEGGGDKPVAAALPADGGCFRPTCRLRARSPLVCSFGLPPPTRPKPPTKALSTTGRFDVTAWHAPHVPNPSNAHSAR